MAFRNLGHMRKRMKTTLFEPFSLGDLTLANRMVMAPMTRNRATRDGLVPPLMVDYYRQRASAGLIITESVPVSPEGVGYPFTPGISTDVQAASWRDLTRAYDQERAQKALSAGAADLVAFGTPFLANPDLPHRYRDKLPLNQADPSTFYGGNETGYTDYPLFQAGPN